MLSCMFMIKLSSAVFEMVWLFTYICQFHLISYRIYGILCCINGCIVIVYCLDCSVWAGVAHHLVQYRMYGELCYINGSIGILHSCLFGWLCVDICIYSQCYPDNPILLTCYCMLILCEWCIPVLFMCFSL